MKRTSYYMALGFAILNLVGCADRCDCSDQKLFESTLNPTPPHQLDPEIAKMDLSLVSEKTPSFISDEELEAEFNAELDRETENDDEVQSKPEKESKLEKLVKDKIEKLAQDKIEKINTADWSEHFKLDLQPAQAFSNAASSAVKQLSKAVTPSPMPAVAAVSRPVRSPKAPPQTFPRPKLTIASHFISIMGQDGVVITVWALARRNWLWAYSPIDSVSFGNIRNWRIERSFRREHFRFVNQKLGTCMQAYGNGLIHDTCDKNNLDQDFELMPTDTGSVFIKSVSQQRCVTYNPVNTQGYDTITLSKCDDNITPLRDQNWYISPPLLNATPDRYWEENP